MVYILVALCGFSLTALADESACNNKYKNLVKLESIFKDDPSAKVPPFFSISSDRIKGFLETILPGFYGFYLEKINQLQRNLNIQPRRGWWNTVLLYFQKWRFSSSKKDEWVHKSIQDAPDYLEKIIAERFGQNFTLASSFPFTESEELFFKNASENNTFLMIRSSGLEDSKTTANAGLYASIAYVNPHHNSYIQYAMGRVVASYFNPQALTNNLMAGLDLPMMPLCIPVLIQQLIGEPLGGAKDPAHIPVSGVAFSTQSSFSSQDFKITEINASYGHGEGVVANRVSTDRYYITPSKIEGATLSIYSMINYKRDRLIPTSDQNNRLALIQNPHHLRVKPCLTTQQVEYLYWVLQKIETAYEQPMDVEFVIKNGITYIVQARPAMKFEQKPSYIPDSALTDKQRNNAISLNTLVAGSSQVCIVTDPSTVIVKETLDEADADERRSIAQAVFVGTWASSLSHAAVNFIGFGIPCFYVQDLNLIKNILPSISSERPLIIDTQRQLVYLWDNSEKSAASAVVSGWYEHPITRALSLIDGIKNHRIALDTAVIPQDTALIQKMSELKSKLGSAGQKELFENIVARINDRISITDKRIASKPNLCDTHCVESFTAFKKQLNSLVANFRQSINSNAERLELLFYHKMLEALLYQTNPHLTGINRYTYRWFLDNLFVSQSIAGSLQVSGDLNKLLEYGHYCPDKELLAGWRTFISKLDILVRSHVIAPTELNPLTSMFSLLEKVNAVPLWFATIFYNQMNNLTSPADSEAIIRTMLKSFDNEYSFSTQQFIAFIESIHATIETIKTAMQQKLDTPASVESFWQEIQRSLIQPLTSNQFYVEWEQALFLGKLLMCQELTHAIDVIDESIKLIKSSRTLSFAERKRLFHMMLKGFLNLCTQWFTNLMPEHEIEYNGPWGLNTYLEKVSELFERIFTDFSNANEVDFFQKSPGFSVEAAVLGSNTAFERHYPQSPEDLFMLIHQNSLVAVTATYKSLFSGKKLGDVLYLPAKFRAVFEYIENDTLFKKSLIGFKYTEKEIVASYNVPLRNHSATFQLSYSFITQDITFHMQYLGESRQRWEQIAVLAAASPELSHLTLEGPIVLDLDGGIVSWKWHISNEKNAYVIMEYVRIMNELSFTPLANVPLAPIHQTPDSIQTIFKKVYSHFSKRIRGSLQQDWKKYIDSTEKWK